MNAEVKSPQDAAKAGGNNSNLAVSDEPTLHPIVELIVQSFDYEYVRKGLYLQATASPNPEPDAAPDPGIKALGMEYYSLYLGANFFTFFTGRSLDQLTTTFFTKELIRDFHLNFTERVSVGISCLPGADMDAFIDGVVAAITRTKPDPESPDLNSLVNKETIQSLYQSPEVLKKLLKSDLWLVTLYVLLVNFQHTNVFSEFISPVARNPRSRT